MQTVLERTPPGIVVVPSLAGVWGRPHTGRPPLEVQMAALQAAFPFVDSVSHFAYAWQEPELERERRTCSGH
ncbi:gsl3216 [Gloeobacter violaceus PCC 7421]|uniref:Gsl3216 protein n=1 Tax=Gloeobacter violaceus (strain ATCC 29082 / PCC 7421) TaxID=251221 RepID=Q7NGF3_GLOVI|nr:gsl3216 [Gloeobacter violaceus PCC 7421]